MTTRRFFSQFCGESFGTTGFVSAYPTAANLLSSTLYTSIKWWIILAARAEDNSQLEGNFSLWIGLLSVCPSTTIGFGTD